MPTQNQQLTSLIPFRPDRDRLKRRIDARIARHGDIQIHHRKTISPAGSEHLIGGEGLGFGVLKIQIALVEQQGLNLGNAERGAVILRDQPIEHPCDVSTDVEGINFRIGIGGLGNYLGFELPLPNKSGFEINARTSRRKHAYSKKPEQSLNTTGCHLHLKSLQRPARHKAKALCPTSVRRSPDGPLSKMSVRSRYVVALQETKPSRELILLHVATFMPGVTNHIPG